tara:strand:+ start:99 stop:290 length:192 start_codon:yes stop_codon:yes gene_type:complete
MFEKFETLIILLLLLLVFYIVIFLGAGNKNKPQTSNKIRRYLFGVRVLIILLATIAIILWFFQ